MWYHLDSSNDESNTSSGMYHFAHEIKHGMKTLMIKYCNL